MLIMSKELKLQQDKINLRHKSLSPAAARNTKYKPFSGSHNLRAFLVCNITRSIQPPQVAEKCEYKLLY